MSHSTHKLKAYMNDAHKPLVFCELCGREEDEGLEQPCTEKFYTRQVDKFSNENYRPFVSGLPDLI